MVRCFIAVEVKDNTALENINKVQILLNQLPIRIKIVKLENMHLTLKFLGEITEKQIQEIQEILNLTKFSSFKFRLYSLGIFPNPNRPRVIWLGITDGQKDLSILAKQVDHLLQKIGFQSEKRDFTPHLTIARVKNSVGTSLKELINNYQYMDFGIIPVSSIKLKRSSLTREGPIYTTIGEWEAQNER